MLPPRHENKPHDLAVALALLTLPLAADDDGPRLEEIDCAFPVQIFSFASQQQSLEMAFMDVKPRATAAGTVVLFQGKNFRGGNYPALGRAADDAIPNARLGELDGVGHLPHIEAFPASSRR